MCFRKNTSVLWRVLFTASFAVIAYLAVMIASFLAALSGGGNITVAAVTALAALGALAIVLAVWKIIRKKFIWIPLV